MAIPVRTSFYIEQGVWVTYSFFLVVVFSLQLQAEMYSKLSKSSIKWKIHRLGLLAAFLCLLISVDPASLHGIYPRNIPPWLSANVTATIISCLVIVKEAAMVVLWRARMKEVPAWLSYESWTMIIILYLTANLSYGVAYWQHKWYWTGIFMMSISIVLIVEACLFAGATYLVVRDLSEAQALTRSSSSSSVRGREQLQKAESQRRTMIMKAVTMLLLAFAVAPLQITSGLNRFHDSKTVVHQPNLDKFEIWDRIFDYAQWTAMAIGLWYSWIPLSPSPDYDTTVRTKETARLLRGQSDSQRSRNSSAGGWKEASQSRAGQRERVNTDSLGRSIDDAPGGAALAGDDDDEEQV